MDRNQKLSNLCNEILLGLFTLISLEDEKGNLLPSKINKKLDPNQNQSIEYQPDYPYLMCDPRIIFIKNLLKMILSQGILTSNNRSMQPFAFRLKRLKSWLIKSNIATFLAQMEWNCGVNCIFCYQKGNPSSINFKKRISQEEIKPRLKYIDLRQNLGLVRGFFCEYDEVLNNPSIAEILRKIRKKDRHKIIEITTNGTPLTPKMIKTLAQIRPLFLVVSLNSANPKIRKWLMNDPHPEVAIAGLPLLKKHRIPFIVSIVVWPGLPFSDIKKTIQHAEENDAYAVRLALPGYSKFFSETKIFDAQAHWIKAVKYFHPLSRKFKVPILIIPHIFIQNNIYERIDLPKIVGIIKNSPAYDYGIKPDDLIKEMNGKPMDSTEEALNELKLNLNNKIKMKIKRDNTIFEIEIKNEKKGRYPFSLPELRRDAPYGFLLAEEALTHDDIKDIGRYIIIHDAKNVLVLVSKRTCPTLKHILKKYNIPKTYGAKIHLATPENRFFGGSIDSGNLLTVEDYIKCIKQRLNKSKPDLIILPASPFSDWGRDITGRINLDIERRIGIPVEFIYNSTIN